MLFSEYITECLIKNKITHCVGIPGVQNTAFYDAISKSQIKSILISNEKEVGYVSLGLHQYTPTCMSLIGGPGITHALTSLYNCNKIMKEAKVKIICITSNIKHFGPPHQLHDVDSHAEILCRSFTDHVYHVEYLNDFNNIWECVLRDDEYGITVIDIPSDLWVKPIQLKIDDISNARFIYNEIDKVLLKKLPQIPYNVGKSWCIHEDIIINVTDDDMMEYASALLYSNPKTNIILDGCCKSWVEIYEYLDNITIKSECDELRIMDKNINVKGEGYDFINLLKGVSVFNAADGYAQCMGFICDGYNRKSDKLGALIIDIDDPDQFMGLSGIGEAFMDSTRMLVITHGKGNEGVRNAIKGLCKFSTRRLDIGLEMCNRHPYAPVHVNFGIECEDVCSLDIELKVLDDLSEYTISHLRSICDTYDNIDGDVVLVFGLGCTHCYEDCIKLANKMQAWVVTTLSGKGIYPETDDQWLWCVIGDAMPQERKRIFEECEMGIFVGCKLSEISTSHSFMKLPKHSYHIGFNAGESVYMNRVWGEAGYCIKWLLENIGVKQNYKKLKSEEIKPRLKIPYILENTNVLTDSGNSTVYVAEACRTLKPKTFFCPADYSSMGFCLPASLGCAIASPNEKTIGYVGDGAFLMTYQVLYGISMAKSQILIIVLRDNELGMISGIQEQMNYNKTAVTLPGYKLEGFANVFGIPYMKYDSAINFNDIKLPAIVEYPVSYGVPSYFADGLQNVNINNRIKVNQYDIWNILERSVGLYGNRIIYDDITYNEFYGKVTQCIEWLRVKYPNAKKGSRLFVHLANNKGRSIMILHYACAGLRWVLVNGNTQLTEYELKYQYELSESIGTITSLPEFDDTIKVYYPEYVPDSFGYQMYFTSGTTGKPKGVVLSYKNVYMHARCMCDEMRFGENDVWAHISFMFHLVDAFAIYSITYVGGKHVFPEQENFNVKNVLELMESNKVTCTNMASMQLDMCVMSGIKRNSLRIISCGGSAPSPKTVDYMINNVGCEFFISYGMTECCGKISMSLLDDEKRERPKDYIHLIQTSGRPFKRIHIKLEKPKEKMGDGVGEVMIKGETVFSGYIGIDRKETFTNDGWFPTGDYAKMVSDDYLTIVGRKKDTIICGSENVYAIEVENVIKQMDGVKNACVVGVPDDILGEKVKAVIVTDKVYNEKDIMNYCLKYLANYKIPRIVECVNELPLTATNKVKKNEIKKENIKNQVITNLPDVYELKYKQVDCDILSTELVYILPEWSKLMNFAENKIINNNTFDALNNLNNNEWECGICIDITPIRYGNGFYIRRIEGTLIKYFNIIKYILKRGVLKNKIVFYYNTSVKSDPIIQSLYSMTQSVLSELQSKMFYMICSSEEIPLFSDNNQFIYNRDIPIMERILVDINKVENKIICSNRSCAIITGGTGDLGQELIKQIIIQMKNINTIIILSRTNKDITKLKKMFPKKEIILHIIKISKNGYEVNIDFVKKLKNRDLYVFHLAGMIGYGDTNDITSEQFIDVVKPKLHNIIGLIERLTEKGVEIKYLVLFSSIFSLFGYNKNLDYAAANGCLNGISDYVNKMGIPTLSLNWGTWGGKGMAVKLGDKFYEYWCSQGMDFIDLSKGFHYMFDLMGKNKRGKYGIFYVNWDKLYRQKQYGLPYVELNESIKNIENTNITNTNIENMNRVLSNNVLNSSIVLRNTSNMGDNDQLKKKLILELQKVDEERMRIDMDEKALKEEKERRILLDKENDIKRKKIDEENAKKMKELQETFDKNMIKLQKDIHELEEEKKKMKKAEDLIKEKDEEYKEKVLKIKQDDEIRAKEHENNINKINKLQNTLNEEKIKLESERIIHKSTVENIQKQRDVYEAELQNTKNLQIQLQNDMDTINDDKNKINITLEELKLKEQQHKQSVAESRIIEKRRRDEYEKNNNELRKMKEKIDIDMRKLEQEKIINEHTLSNIQKNKEANENEMISIREQQENLYNDMEEIENERISLKMKMDSIQSMEQQLRENTIKKKKMDDENIKKMKKIQDEIDNNMQNLEKEKIINKHTMEDIYKQKNKNEDEMKEITQNKLKLQREMDIIVEEKQNIKIAMENIELKEQQYKDMIMKARDMDIKRRMSEEENLKREKELREKLEIDMYELENKKKLNDNIMENIQNEKNKYEQHIKQTQKLKTELENKIKCMDDERIILQQKVNTMNINEQRHNEKEKRMNELQSRLDNEIKYIEEQKKEAESIADENKIRMHQYELDKIKTKRLQDELEKKLNEISKKEALLDKCSSVDENNDESTEDKLNKQINNMLSLREKMEEQIKKTEEERLITKNLAEETETLMFENKEEDIRRRQEHNVRVKGELFSQLGKAETCINTSTILTVNGNVENNMEGDDDDDENIYCRDDIFNKIVTFIKSKIGEDIEICKDSNINDIIMDSIVVSEFIQYINTLSKIQISPITLYESKTIIELIDNIFPITKNKNEKRIKKNNMNGLDIIINKDENGLDTYSYYSVYGGDGDKVYLRPCTSNELLFHKNMKHQFAIPIEVITVDKIIEKDHFFKAIQCVEASFPVTKAKIKKTNIEVDIKLQNIIKVVFDDLKSDPPRASESNIGMYSVVNEYFENILYPFNDYNLILFVILNPIQNKSHIIMTYHHAFYDGVSLSELQNVLFDCYDKSLKGITQFKLKDYGLPLSIEHLTQCYETNMKGVDDMQEMVRIFENMSSPLSECNTIQSLMYMDGIKGEILNQHMEHVLYNRFRTAKFKLFCKENRVSFYSYMCSLVIKSLVDIENSKLDIAFWGITNARNMIPVKIESGCCLLFNMVRVLPEPLMDISHIIKNIHNQWEDKTNCVERMFTKQRSMTNILEKLFEMISVNNFSLSDNGIINEELCKHTTELNVLKNKINIMIIYLGSISNDYDMRMKILKKDVIINFRKIIIPSICFYFSLIDDELHCSISGNVSYEYIQKLYFILNEL